jgi:superfamily II DNA or RNA helicase
MDRMRRDPYGHGTWMNLSEFDSSLLWLHLARAESMGVQLVGEDPKDTIALADAIDPVIDLTATETGGVRLARRVRIDGVVVDMAGIVAVGATGYAANIVDGDHKVLVVGPHGRAARPEETDAIGGEVTVVPGCDLEEFRTTFLAGLIQRAEVLSTDGSVEVPEPVAPVAVLRLEVRGPDRLDAEWWWAYGEAADDAARIPLGSSATVQGIRRDAAAELSILSQVAAVCRRWPRLPMPGAPRERTGRVGDAGRDGDATRRGVPVRGTDVIDLVTGLIPDLTGIDGVRVEVVGELPDLRERTEAPHLTITATASDDSTDWLDLGVTVRVEGVDVPFRDLFAALAQGQDRMILADGTYIRLDQPAFAQLRALIEEADRLSDNPTRPQVSRYDASLWGELEELADETQADTPWIESLATLRALADSGETPAPLPAPEGLVATLRPYQHRAFEWLAFLWHHRIGGILADDMGLGKTVEALTLIAHTREAARGRVREGDAELVRAGAIGSSGAGGCDPEPGRPPFLVVAPSSVVGNWVSEAARFTPHLTVRALTQTRAKHGVPLDAEARGADVLVTSYAIFRLDHAEFAALEWDGLILDEAQFAKNHLTRANQCARALRAPFKLAVTGTPMENSVEELWAVFAIVAPGLLGTRRRFKEDYAGPIAEEAGGFPRPALDQLRRRIRPLLMRRTKEEVAPELPERTEQVIQVELAKAHRRAYDTFLHRERRRLLGLLSDFNANRFAIFRSLTLLRRMALDASLISPQYLGTPSSKLDVLFTQLGDVIGGGHRALVFSQFTTYLRKVAERLDADGIDYAYLDGTTTRRPAVINGFKKGTAPVFLISLKAGGFGLNLTEADYVFLLDPWWNPATENQAIDRTHRIGQTKPVMVTRLVSADTIEDKVMALKERKAALFNAVLDDDGTFSDSLSAADIRTLLGE